MIVWINLELHDGNFECGFAKNQLQVTVADVQDNLIHLKAELAPHAKIPLFYQRYQEQYYSLLKHSRGNFKDNLVTNILA